uniref:NADH-ubiquinone oxidoreductase chain 1 n=1 Tax=Petaloconchus erectus TaxID=766169 RepID=E2FLW2_9CAEN|nr:NADH dehydrogenase subunit 1 [Petaloconchus erectus]
MMSVMSLMFTYISVILAVAFFTLLERKSLSYIQVRKGPNKVGLAGFPQPMADALKLLSKESVLPNVSNSLIFLIAPVFSFFLAMMLWQLYPMLLETSLFSWGVLFFLCVTAMNVYGTLLAGWSSNSKYALLGALRGVAQTISYEVSMALVLLFPLFISSSMSFLSIMENQNKCWITFLMVPMFFVWLLTCVAETNRAPLDFAEGESELVSGFNIEYGGTGFALIFLAEYANILLMSLLSSILFLGGPFILGVKSSSLVVLKILLVSFMFIWARGSYPRLRYDLLMDLTWKGFLPFGLSMLLLLVSVLSILE